MKNVILAILILLLSGCKSMYGNGSNWTLAYNVKNIAGDWYEIRDAKTYNLVYNMKNVAGDWYDVYY